MNKKMLTAPIIAALLAFGGLASAAPYNVTISDSHNVSSSTLYTESAWQTIRIPLSALGGVFPSTNLTLSAVGLPEGVTIALTGVKQVDNDLVLSVNTERSNTAKAVNGLANVTLFSGGTALTSFQVPVLGAAIDTE